MSQDFKEFVELLTLHNVKYLVAGGYAVGIYGYPRYTGDIDFWIDASAVNAEKMLRVFNDFGLGSFGLTVEDLCKAEQIVQVGYPPLRIDVLTSIDGVVFKDAWPNRKVVDVDGVTVNFIGLEDLKKNKLSAGRNKDLEDLRNLENND